MAARSSLPKAARIASVDQEHPATPVSLLDTILAADVEREALECQAGDRRARAACRNLPAADRDRRRQRAGASRRNPQRPGFLHRRPRPRRWRSFPAAGGCAWRWRPRCSREPELLLLDEPTNYLDLEGALWLEARLKKYPHTALIVSHDRELLNNSVDAILHLSEGKLELYTGGYDDFERRRAEKTRLLGGDQGQAGCRARASAKIHRPFPRQGQQGGAGAIAHQAPRQA